MTTCVRLLIFVLAFLAAALLAGLARSEGLPCGPYQKVEAAITGAKYRESIALRLVTADGKGQVIVFTNPDTQTWTTIFVNASGFACITGAGQGVVIITQPKGNPT